MEQLQAAYEAQQKEIAHMEAFVERFRAKNTKAKQAQDRQRSSTRSSASSCPKRASRSRSASRSRRVRATSS